MSRHYLVLKENRIIMQLNSTQPLATIEKSLVALDYDTIQEFPQHLGSSLNLGIKVSEDIRIYDENWTKRPLLDLVNDGLLVLEPNQYIEDNVIKTEELADVEV